MRNLLLFIVMNEKPVIVHSDGMRNLLLFIVMNEKPVIVHSDE